MLRIASGLLLVVLAQSLPHIVKQKGGATNTLSDKYAPAPKDLAPEIAKQKEDQLEKAMAESPLTKKMDWSEKRVQMVADKQNKQVDEIMKSAKAATDAKFDAKKVNRSKYEPSTIKNASSWKGIVKDAKDARVVKPPTPAKVALAGCGAIVPIKTLGIRRQKALSMISHSITTSTKGPAFEKVSGPCTVEGDCFISKNYESSNYGNDNDCKVKYTGTRPLQVESFDIETGWDFLYVNGVQYTGRGVANSPDGVLPGANSEMHFISDFCCTRPGFKICVPPPAEHAGAASFAKPGVGSVQGMKEGGTTGTVDNEEIFLKVLKDGFFDVGCFNDAMLEFGDKYGNNADKYGSVASHANVSIVKYTELVHKEDRQPMTPRVCFEFCRTIQGMVFFGISNGDECYCEPYYKPQAGDADGCDVPCVGDPTQMCGSTKKSTVWEMHLCADTAEDIKKAVISGTEALSFFHESAALANLIADKMSAAGDALETVAGLSGSPDSGDLGMAAKQAGGVLSKAFIPGRKMYEALYKPTKDAKTLEGEDFTDASTASLAERAVEAINANDHGVVQEAKKIYDLVMASYPAADYDPLDGKEKDILAKYLKDDSKKVVKDYRDASYAFDTTMAPEASTCAGALIGLPKISLGVNGCGLACDQTLHPEKCVGFGHYQVDGTEDLCFLFSSVKDVEVFMPPAATKLLQKESLRKTKAGDPASAQCMIKMSELATGLKPKGELKTRKRCFGACGGFEPRILTKVYPIPSKVELQGNEVIPAP